MYILRNYNIIFISFVVMLFFFQSESYKFANIINTPFLSLIISIFVIISLWLIIILWVNLSNSLIVKYMMDSGRYKFFVKELNNTLFISLEHLCISVFVYIFEFKIFYYYLLLLTGVLLFDFVRIANKTKNALETNIELEKIRTEVMKG